MPTLQELLGGDAYGAADPNEPYYGGGADPSPESGTGDSAKRSMLLSQIFSGDAPAQTPEPFHESSRGGKINSILALLGDSLNAVEGYKRSNAKHPLREGTPDVTPPGYFGTRLAERRRQNTVVVAGNAANAESAKNRAAKGRASYELGRMDKAETRTQVEKDRDENARLARRFSMEKHAVDYLNIANTGDMTDAQLYEKMAVEGSKKAGQVEADKQYVIKQRDQEMDLQKLRIDEARNKALQDKPDVVNKHRMDSVVTDAGPAIYNNYMGKTVGVTPNGDFLVTEVGQDGKVATGPDGKPVTHPITVDEMKSLEGERAKAAGLDQAHIDQINRVIDTVADRLRMKYGKPPSGTRPR